MKKTNINKLRNANFLGSWDLEDDSGVIKDIIVTIKGVESKLVFNQRKQKEESVVTLLLEECKPLILNATNRTTLNKVTNTVHVEEMLGKKIQLTAIRGRWFGSLQDAIRVVNVVPSVAIPVDIAKCKLALNEAKTVQDLALIWECLTPEARKTSEVLSEKERLKIALNG
jgi:uncharacterized membrane protein